VGKIVHMEKDIEKSVPAPTYNTGHQDPDSTVVTKEGTKFSRFVDSFKKNPNARMVTELTDAEGKPLPDQPPAEPALAMSLKGRHLQMIAIGGSIGNKRKHAADQTTKYC
jgi:amino acid transporter